MDDFKVYRAKTVNDAITDALIDLETTSDKLEYEVVEEGSAGILGLFSRMAVIKARKKIAAKPSVKKEEKPAANIKAQPKSEMRSSVNAQAKASAKDDVKVHSKAEVKPQVKKEAKPQLKNESKPQQLVVNDDAAKLKEQQPSINEERRPERKKSDKPVDQNAIRNVLSTLFAKLDITADIDISEDENEPVVNINVTGENTGDIIGKRGQTLDAIQYLLSVIVNKEQEGYYRVKLDTNNYRERRQKTLENLAKNMASKVKKTRHKVTLEPMNPYERRVIHSYLQADKFITTKSEGEEPNRRVVIYYKGSGQRQQSKTNNHNN